MSVIKQVEIDCKVVRETDKAYLIDYGHAKDQAWIPKSQVDDYCEERDGTITSIFIPEWLAKDKGLI